MEIVLKDRSEGPYYLQVRTQIEALIRDRKLASGEALPAPGQLARQLSIDKGEVQRSYFELEHAGLISKSVGRDFLGKEQVSYKVK